MTAPNHRHEHGEECLSCELGADEALAAIERMIQNHGHAVIATHVDTEDGLLPLSFTAGLARSGLPELMVFALSAEVAHAILGNCARKLRQDGVVWDAEIHEIIDPMPVVFKKAHLAKAREAAEMLFELAGDAKVEVAQVVWPDRTGAFPWDQGFDASLRARQPLLTLDS